MINGSPDAIEINCRDLLVDYFLIFVYMKHGIIVVICFVFGIACKKAKAPDQTNTLQDNHVGEYECLLIKNGFSFNGPGGSLTTYTDTLETNSLVSINRLSVSASNYSVSSDTLSFITTFYNNGYYYECQGEYCGNVKFYANDSIKVIRREAGPGQFGAYLSYIGKKQ